jgi:hypothetical protein
MRWAVLAFLADRPDDPFEPVPIYVEDSFPTTSPGGSRVACFHSSDPDFENRGENGIYVAAVDGGGNRVRVTH